MLGPIAATCFRRRRLVVLAWLLALVGFTVASSVGGGDWESNARLDGTDAQRAYDLLAAEFPSQAGETATAVFRDPDGIEPGAISGFVADVARIPGVAAVSSPFDGDGQISADGTIAFAPITFVDDDEGLDVTVDQIRERAGPLRDAGVQVEFGGWWFAEGGVPATEGLGLLAAAIILLLAFGSLLAMGLPLVTALFGIGIGLAGVGLWANFVSTPDFTSQVASMIGIGVGIDYALFIVTRYREALVRGLRPIDAVVEAASTAGRAVFFAGITVMVSLLGMFLMRLEFLQGLAVGTSFAVLVAVVAAVTLLPALLGFTGTRIATRHIRRAERQAAKGRVARETVWHRWSRLLQRRPKAAAGIGLATLLALGGPVLALRLGAADEGNSPSGSTNRIAYDTLAEGFGPGFNGPFVIAVDAPDAAAREDVPTLVERLRSTDGVAFVSDAHFNDAGTTAVVNLVPTTSPQDRATEQLLHHLRDDVVPDATASTGLSAFIGGATPSNVDFSTVIAERLPWFIGGVLLVSFVLLMAVFRSVLVPLKAVLMNLLSIGAAYGVMVAVFQWGWFGSLLGIGEGGPIEPWAPMMLFAIVFGLSMDYEVFLLSKVREAYDATGDNSVAVVEGLAGTARVITAAAAIMVCVFGFFVFGDDRAIKLIGLGLSTAVFIDATLVRMVLVPATMELLGDKNWWFPRWLDRVVPRLAVEG